MQYRSKSSRNFKNVGEEYDKKDTLCSIFYRNLKNQNCHSKQIFSYFILELNITFLQPLNISKMSIVVKLVINYLFFSRNLADLSFIFKRLIILNVEDSSLF